jgi:hypothetical protein
MRADEFYQELIKICAQPPYNRYGRLAELHTEIVMRYLSTLRTMTRKQARQSGADGRTIAQVVGHIAEWERYVIFATAEIVNGIKWPRIMTFTGFLDTDGQELSFDSTDAFNAHHAAKHATQPWEEIQELAIHTATALHTIFTQPAILSPDSLQRTNDYKWRLPSGITLTVPVGWYLWLVSIEHEAVDHAKDLGWQ